jgi:putative transposase
MGPKKQRASVTSLIRAERIERSILLIRGEKVMLDADIAQDHLVWIPKYRKPVLQGNLQQEHPDVEIAQCSIRPDPVHLVAVVPPTYAVAAGVGKIKAKTRRAICQRFPWVKQVDGRNEFWSVGFFSATVGVKASSSSSPNAECGISSGYLNGECRIERNNAYGSWHWSHGSG